MFNKGTFFLKTVQTIKGNYPLEKFGLKQFKFMRTMCMMLNIFIAFLPHITHKRYLKKRNHPKNYI